MPKSVQYREPILNGTLREVGFGKSFAYKLYNLSLNFIHFSLRRSEYNFSYFLVKEIDIIIICEDMAGCEAL